MVISVKAQKPLRQIHIGKINKQIIKAEKSVDKRNYPNALSWYLKAYKKGDRKSIDILKIAGCYYFLGDSFNSKKWLVESINNGFNDTSRSILKKHLFHLYAPAEWDTIIMMIIANKSQQKIHKDAEKALLRASLNDQIIRSKSDSVCALSDTSEQCKALLSQREAIDSINLELVIDLLRNHSWFLPEEVGHEAAYAQFLIIQHGNLDIQKKYFNAIREQVLLRNLDFETYALLSDRIRVSSGKKQIYGTQLFMNTKLKKLQPFKIKSPLLVNIRRHRLGMESLKQYLKNFE